MNESIKLILEVNKDKYGRIHIPKELNGIFSNNLKLQRNIEGFTIRECSKYTCIPESIWTKLEDNPTKASLQDITIICDFLELEISDLFKYIQ